MSWIVQMCTFKTAYFTTMSYLEDAYLTLLLYFNPSMFACQQYLTKTTLQKLHNSKLWYRPLNHKQEQNRRGFWQGRTWKTTTNNNVEKKWSKSGRYLFAYMSVNMLNMSDNKPTICRTECFVVHHVRYHVRYLTPKRHPENEIIKIRKIHFIP